MKLTIFISLFTCLALGLGCRSAQQGESAALASVAIQGNTPGQIREMAETVFHENGYQITSLGRNGLVCDKRASKWNNLAYGSWMADDPVWVRVKLAIVPAGEMTFRLECQAHLLADRGGPTEEEIKSGSLRRGPYQELLAEVARRLHSPAGQAGEQPSLQPPLK